MSVNVENMTWNDLRDLVTRRLNRLAMCKRGAVQTDINAQAEKLGKCPEFTKEERQKIDEGLAKKIKKAMTPTIADVNRMSSIHALGNTLTRRAEKVKDGCYDHPGKQEWCRKVDLLKQQETERIATLDSDFQDVIDEFTLSGADVGQFRKEFNRLDAMEW